MTKARIDTAETRQAVYDHLKSKNAVSELFQYVAEMGDNYSGAYTRIIGIKGHSKEKREMCVVQLVTKQDRSQELEKKRILEELDKELSLGGAGEDDIFDPISVSAYVKYPNPKFHKRLRRHEYPKSIKLFDIQGDIELKSYDVTSNALSKYESQLLEYHKGINMGTIDNYGRQNYNFNVSIFIDDDDKNYIVKDRDYSIDIKLRIDDPDKSKELLETFCVHFHTNKLDIASHDSFSKFKFEDSNEAECSLKIKPEHVGDTEFCLDFYQNRNMFYQKKFNVKIVSSEYAL